MGITPNKRIRLRLTSDRQFTPLDREAYLTGFTGSIRIVLTGRRIELHVTEEVVALPNNNNNNMIGIDRGFTDLITTSQKRRYGKGFNLPLTKESDHLCQKNAKRNRLRAL